MLRKITLTALLVALLALLSGCGGQPTNVNVTVGNNDSRPNKPGIHRDDYPSPWALRIAQDAIDSGVLHGNDPTGKNPKFNFQGSPTMDQVLAISDRTRKLSQRDTAQQIQGFKQQEIMPIVGLLLLIAGLALLLIVLTLFVFLIRWIISLFTRRRETDYQRVQCTCGRNGNNGGYHRRDCPLHPQYGQQPQGPAPEDPERTRDRQRLAGVENRLNSVEATTRRLGTQAQTDREAALAHQQRTDQRFGKLKKQVKEHGQQLGEHEAAMGVIIDNQEKEARARQALEVEVTSGFRGLNEGLQALLNK